MISCIIVDDEPIARLGIKEYINGVGDMMLIGECENTSQLNLMLQRQIPEVIFLDIEMPYRSGLDWLKSTNNPPLIVITTAYEQYAIQGYDFDVVDYLLKPFSQTRFNKAVEKIRNRLSDSSMQDYIILSTNKSKCQKVFYKDIASIEAQQNYCKISLANNTCLLVRSTLSSLLESLPLTRFLRVHRSFAVNVAMISSVENTNVIVNETEIPLSSSYKNDVINFLSLDQGH